MHKQIDKRSTQGPQTWNETAMTVFFMELIGCWEWSKPPRYAGVPSVCNMIILNVCLVIFDENLKNKSVEPVSTGKQRGYVMKIIYPHIFSHAGAIFCSHGVLTD